MRERTESSKWKVPMSGKSNKERGSVQIMKETIEKVEKRRMVG
jgi:hypothetical protein